MGNVFVDSAKGKVRLLSHPVLYLSKYIIVNKTDYYYNLAAVTQRGAWKPWILFMLDAVEVTASMSNELINEIVGQMTATLEHGKKHVKWYTKEVNEALFHQPYSRAKMMAML